MRKSKRVNDIRIVDSSTIAIDSMVNTAHVPPLEVVLWCRGCDWAAWLRTVLALWFCQVEPGTQVLVDENLVHDLEDRCFPNPMTPQNEWMWMSGGSHVHCFRLHSAAARNAPKVKRRPRTGPKSSLCQKLKKQSPQIRCPYSRSASWCCFKYLVTTAVEVEVQRVKPGRRS